MSEINRLRFIELRDVVIEAKSFAKRTLKLYRGCLKNTKHHARLLLYRKGFVESCLTFRKYHRGASCK